MPIKTVTSTEFRQKVGQYIDAAGKEPVIITQHSQPSRVLVDFELYERLKEYDTRRALYPHELDEETRARLEEGYQGEETSHLDHLLD